MFRKLRFPIGVAAMLVMLVFFYDFAVDQRV